MKGRMIIYLYGESNLNCNDYYKRTTMESERRLLETERGQRANKHR